MPKNISLYAGEMRHKLDSPDLQPNEAIKTSFITNSQQIISALTTAYANYDMPSKVQAHVALCGLLKILNCTLIEQYFIQIDDQYLQQQLTACVNRAFNNAHPQLNASAQQVANFAQANVNSWIIRIRGDLSADMFSLDKILESLADLIAVQFLNQVVILCRYDIYSKFHFHVKEELRMLPPYVTAEIDLDAIRDVIKNYTPVLYGLPADNSDYEQNIQTNPVVLVNDIEHQFFIATTRVAASEQIPTMLAPLIPLATGTQSIINNCNPNLTAQQISKILQNRFAGREFTRYRIMYIADQVSISFFHEWMTSNDYGWAFELIKSYKDGYILKRGAACLFEKLLEQMEPYFVLPEFVREAPVQQAITEREAKAPRLI
jgi:hypothetical protein